MLPPEYYEALKNILYDAQNRLQQLKQAGYQPLIEEQRPVQKPKQATQSNLPSLPARPAPSAIPGKPHRGSSHLKNEQTTVVKSAGKQLKLVYEYVNLLL